MLCYEEDFHVQSRRREPFGCAMANFFEVRRKVSICWWTFRCYLHVASQSLTHLYHVSAYNFFRLAHFSIANCFMLSEGTKNEIFREQVVSFHSIL